MRRPVIFLFLFYIFGIAFAFYWKPGSLFFIAACVLLFLFFLMAVRSEQNERFRHYRKPICMLAVLWAATLLGGLCLSLAERQTDPLESISGSETTVAGRILTIQAKDENYRRILITAEGTGKRLIQVQGPMGPPEELIGKWAVVRGIVTIPSGQRNPGLFDYQLYLKTRGIRVILQSSSGEIEMRQEHSSVLFSAIARLKYGFLNRLEKQMEPGAYGMLVGMLFGDSSLIGEDVYEAFQKNGVAHILSVSGIHVAIVYLFLSKILGNRKTKTFYSIAAVLLLLYAALSEFSPCVVRSVIMILIHIFSKVSFRRYDFMTCTAVSALVMLVYNPYYLFNTGFQLSYLAVFWLAALLPWSERKIKIFAENGMNEFLVEILRYLSPLLIIQLGMAPVTAYLFNYFSLVSFFVNPPIIAISGAIIPIGILLIPLSFAGGIPFGVCAQAAELLTEAMIWLNELFYLPGKGSFHVVSPPVALLLLFYAFSFFLSSECFRILYQRKQRGASTLVVLLIAACCMIFSAAADPGTKHAEMVFLDVGQGDCLFVQTPNGKNILVDGGGKQDYSVGEKILLPYLLKRGVTSIDLAFVTHLHDDHFLGIRELAGEMEIKKLCVYDANRMREQELLAQTGLDCSHLMYLCGGDIVRTGDEVNIEVLYPEKAGTEQYREMVKEEADENLSSLVLKVNYGELSVLMTGDMGFPGEEAILEEYQDCTKILSSDILKVGHHGSRTSTSDAFLDAVSPNLAVFQVGKNNYGHPHPTVIEKCSQKGIMIYRNDQNGAIILDKRGETWHLRVMLPKSMHIRK